jgi:hypothetical protein
MNNQHALIAALHKEFVNPWRHFCFAPDRIQAMVKVPHVAYNHGGCRWYPLFAALHDSAFHGAIAQRQMKRIGSRNIHYGCQCD